MTKEEKIDFIYREIADKTLSFGCMVRYPYHKNLGVWVNDRVCIRSITKKGVVETTSTCCDDRCCYGRGTNYFGEYSYQSSIKDIIGHPVMIGDVLDWYLLNDDWSNPNSMLIILLKWKEKREPIEDQSAGCIDFVYGLI